MMNAMENKGFKEDNDCEESKSDGLIKERKSQNNIIPKESNPYPIISERLTEHLKNLHRKLSLRTEVNKLKIIRPITPDSEEEEELKQAEEETKEEDDLDAEDVPEVADSTKANRLRLGSIINGKMPDIDQDDFYYVKLGNRVLFRCIHLSAITKLFTSTFDCQNKFYLAWLTLTFLCVVYNYFSIPLRECFDIYNEPYEFYWIIFDYSSDVVYVLDIILVQHRIQYLNSGIIERNHKMCAINYKKTLKFKLDVLSIIPTDLFYLIIKKYRGLLRLTRLFKFNTFWELFDLLDRIAKSGHIIRILRTVCYMVYLIHIEASFYYLMSRYLGFGTDEWVFTPKPEQYSAYIFCFHLAAKTSTSIGNNPQPTRTEEYIFMNVYWLFGVFVFAVLIGQIGDIFEAANANRTNYRKTVDTTVLYLRNLNLPESLINKVKTWFTYNWEQQKTLDENSLLEGLPKKLKADLAINTHFNTLSKVSLFQDCERTLLSDLILNLKPVVFLPKDYICRKGEVGTEMYIVKSGQVEVVGGPNNSLVFATLKEGSVFGEISLLALSGGNRRTADVRSKGFATLFTLSKQDFEEAMADYPAAYEMLKKKAKKVLNRQKKREKVTVAKEETPIIIPEKEEKENKQEFSKTVQLAMKNNKKESIIEIETESICSTLSDEIIELSNYSDSTLVTQSPTPTFDRGFYFDDRTIRRMINLEFRRTPMAVFHSVIDCISPDNSSGEETVKMRRRETQI